MSADEVEASGRILVTGASGFIGRYVMSILGPRAVPWRRDADGDIHSAVVRERVLDAEESSVVLHLAWASTGRDDYTSLDENMLWPATTAALARECCERDIRFVGIGSAVDQDREGRLDTPYALAKEKARIAVLGISGPVTWASPQYVFSLRDRRPRLMRALLNSPEAELFQPSMPDAVKDFIHVEDVASALAAIVTHGLLGAIYVGSGSLRSPQQLVDATRDALGIPCVESRKYVTVRRSVQQPTALRGAGWHPSATERFFQAPSP